ncbi:MAG: ATP-dependent ligase [Caulobacter sp.]|nr:ATP-dependent ligase [Caulobacter sp.]
MKGLALDTAPMEARQVDELPTEAGWQYEPKWDGFRCLAFRDGDEVDLRAKSGKPLGRYFPEMLAALAALPAKRFVVDGELVIPTGDGLSFEALQMRLHPAESRVHRLAAETPARLKLFDCLMDAKGQMLLDQPLSARREALEAFHRKAGKDAPLDLTPFTLDVEEARGWLKTAGLGALDGVVAKRRDGPYLPGERAMLKIKRRRTADCVVGGFRYLQSRREVGSLLLGLYDDEGRLDHVGFTSTITNAERPKLTRELEALVEPPGFTGDAPGGPSRWSAGKDVSWQPLKPDLVVEVRYDQVTGGRMRHGATLLRWRPDKAARQCRREQLAL